ncbi:MAG: PASTA domain-containing protein [Desulfobacterota bacterium]|nr:PASTA domain-containing protein [Thermodesulfobacteriota bacterium]
MFLYLIAFFSIFAISVYLTTGILLKSKREVLCPEVRGLYVSEAEKILEDLGLILEVSKYEKRDDVERGVIVRQRPEPNVPVKLGRKVYVTISLGPELISVPDLRGLFLDAAENVLKDNKLSLLRVIFVPSHKDGKVVAQIPAYGEKIKEKGGVVLIVGKRPDDFFVVPDLKSSTLDELLDELDSKKIAFKVVSINGDSLDARCTITSEKKAGSILRPGEVLTFNVKCGG